MRGARNMKYAVQLGIKNEKTGKYLLILRDDNSEILNPGLWGPVGGEINLWEHSRDAAVREEGEEIKDVAIRDIIFLDDIMIQEDPNKDEKTRVFMYLAKTYTDVSKVEVLEGQRVDEFTLDEMMALNGTVPRLKELLQKYRPVLENY